jgi:WD40 repeat protein
LIRSLSIHTRRVHNLALRPGNGGLPMVASVSDDRTVRLWQPTIGRMVRFARLKSRPLDAAWFADGSRVVVACTDGHVRVVDPVSVKVTHDIPALEGWAYSLAVHPTDGSILVGGQDGRVRRLARP